MIRITYTTVGVSIVIGELLAEVRKDHQETQKDLAEHLHVSVATIRSWERENSSPSHEMLIAICKLYRVSADYLLGLTRVDPVRMQKQQERLTSDELAEVQSYSEYLLWKRNQSIKNKDG